MNEISKTDLVQRFKACTLNKTLWTHEAHQIVAIWHLMYYEPFDALCRLRSGIIAYNLSVGGVNDWNNGYHETITIFWWALIKSYIEHHRDLSFDEMCNSFLTSRYTQRNIAFEYYTRELLLSTEARARYLAPDLKDVTLYDE